MIKLVVLGFLLSCSFCFCQKVEFNYLPKNKDSVMRYITAVHEKKIVKFGDNHKKVIAKKITESQKRFIGRLNDSSFIFNKKITSYLNTVVNEIYDSNPSLDRKDFYFFIEKSAIPNASCYGNGIFTVTLGLFNIISSDDELASVICHEMAHYYLEHTDKSLLKMIESINSKEVQKKADAVRDMQYGKRKAYSELMDELNFNFLKRSQSVEIEADSLGLLLFKKTKYNINASISFLKNLKKANTLLFNQESKLQEHLNFENYPFKEAWLAKEETLFDLSYISDDFILDSDSIGTHPAIPLRIKKLDVLIDQDGNTSTINSVNLEEIKKITALISINNFIDSNRIDLALYQCLLLYNQKLLDQKEYVSTLSQLLKKTYELKNNHSFGKYISPIYPFSDEHHLNEIKLFLHNIELKNVKKIGLYFCLSNEEVMKDDTSFKSTLQFFKSLNP
jgi:hypothetical protein